MTTATIDIDPRTSQRMSALQRANATRIAGADLKRELRAGKITIADALADDRAAHLPILTLLLSQFRWGRAKALPILREQRISETKPVGELTARQRAALTEACA